LGRFWDEEERHEVGERNAAGDDGEPGVGEEGAEHVGEENSDGELHLEEAAEGAADRAGRDLADVDRRHDGDGADAEAGDDARRVQPADGGREHDRHPADDQGQRETLHRPPTSDAVGEDAGRQRADQRPNRHQTPDPGALLGRDRQRTLGRQQNGQRRRRPRQNGARRERTHRRCKKRTLVKVSFWKICVCDENGLAKKVFEYFLCCFQTLKIIK